MLEAELLSSLELFFSHFALSRFKKRDVILGSEEPNPSVFFVKLGYIRVYRVSEDGEELTLIILKPGDLFPVIWGTENLQNSYYLEALTPVEVLKVPKESFNKYLEERPDVAFGLINRAMTRYGGLLTRIEYLIFGNAYTKVAATLLVCAKRFGQKRGDQIVVDLPLTHKDIATMVGITRETTCLEMKKLEKRGFISHQGRFFVIKDIEGLEHESLMGNEQGTLLHYSL